LISRGLVIEPVSPGHSGSQSKESAALLLLLLHTFSRLGWPGIPILHPVIPDSPSLRRTRLPWVRFQLADWVPRQELPYLVPLTDHAPFDAENCLFLLWRISAHLDRGRDEGLIVTCTYSRASSAVVHLDITRYELPTFECSVKGGSALCEQSVHAGHYEGAVRPIINPRPRSSPPITTNSSTH
jgi:hypothetical protein